MLVPQICLSPGYSTRALVMWYSLRRVLDDAMSDQMSFCEKPLHILVLPIWGPWIVKSKLISSPSRGRPAVLELELPPALPSRPLSYLTLLPPLPAGLPLELPPASHPRASALHHRSCALPASRPRAPSGLPPSSSFRPPALELLPASRPRACRQPRGWAPRRPSPRTTPVTKNWPKTGGAAVQLSPTLPAWVLLWK
jgi:hypothetical protein